MYILLTPRNGRKKFRSPVHSPSRVLQCTSRTPPPSSSRAHSPAPWLTVAWPRPAASSGLYPFHSSVYTIAPDCVCGTTVWSTSSAAPLRPPPRRESRRPARPTTPQTGGRSVAQVPCPTALLARRRGGSSGSICGTPFFPRVLVRLVGLDRVVRQRQAVAVGRGAGLDLVPQLKQVPAAGPELAGQLGGRDPLDEPPQDQQDRGGGAVGPLPGGAGEEVEHPAAGLAPIVDD